MATTSAIGALRQVKSCGFFVMKSNQSFLLMKHPERYDLPKGHMEPEETEQQTALRGKRFIDVASSNNEHEKTFDEGSIRMKSTLSVICLIMIVFF